MKSTIKKMNRLGLALLVFLVVSCKSRYTNDISSGTQKRKVAVFHIDDASISTSNNILYYDSTTAHDLYMLLATQEEAVIKHAFIKSKSQDQHIFTLPVQRLDTASNSEDNVYLKAKNKNNKEKALATFQAQAQKDIQRYIAEIYKQRKEQLSDINGVCQLLETTLTQTAFSDFEKIIIFSSDMRNHIGGKRETPITTTHLPNTTIAFIRPALSKDSLAKIFPDSEIEVTDASDIISFLKTKLQ